MTVHIFANPYRQTAGGMKLAEDIPYPSVEASRPMALLARCPEAAPTPLHDVSGLVDIARLSVKDESTRMGLGSFKALGAAYVIARDNMRGEAAERTYVTASAGNHGLSVAMGAKVFGAKAVIYIAETVPEAFGERLRALGATVCREGANYEASMAAAQSAVDIHGWYLLSDSSWEGYTEPPFYVMEGYLCLMAEVFEQIGETPTHIYLQAGVGGLAASCAAAIRARWGEAPTIIVVEPDAAPALITSVQAGGPVLADGPVSSMGRLDCKEPSWIALKGLARDADWFCTLSDAEVEAQLAPLAAAGLHTTPSGGAGLAACLTDPRAFGLTRASRVLCILSEGPA